MHSCYYKGNLAKLVADAVIKKIRHSFVGGAFGWEQSDNRNRHLVFKNFKGRVRLWETGTVELYVKKPASNGKCMQLFCDAFTKNYLVTDIRVLDSFRASLMRRCHATFDTGEKLPYMKVTAFKESHHLTFVSGDRTHPTSFEFMYEYNAEVRTARDLVKEFRSFVERLGFKDNETSSTSKVKDLDPSTDYAV